MVRNMCVLLKYYSDILFYTFKQTKRVFVFLLKCAGGTSSKVEKSFAIKTNSLLDVKKDLFLNEEHHEKKSQHSQGHDLDYTLDPLFQLSDIECDIDSNALSITTISNYDTQDILLGCHKTSHLKDNGSQPAPHNLPPNIRLNQRCAASSSMESVRVSKGNVPQKDYSHMNQTNQNTPNIPRVIQEQSNPKYITKHFRERSFTPLSIPGDNYFLSPFLVFVRPNCIEVVTAKEEDVIRRQKLNKIEVDQIGIRCRFCAHRNYDERRKRSACYPSTISRIYQSISMMIRDHFMVCDDMPIDVRENYIFLKTSTIRGSNNSKGYWKNRQDV